MSDLYALLGVKRGATALAIRKAFLRLSKKHHPDMPDGDAETFREIEEAYRVLHNHETRSYYDAHGTPPPNKPNVDQEKAALYQMLNVTLMGALATVNPTSENLLAAMRAHLHKGKQELEKQVANGRGMLQRLEVVKKRVTTMNPENVLASIIQTQITAAETEIKRGQEIQLLLDKGLKFLDDYGYEVDRPNDFAGFGSQSTNPYQNAGLGGWR